MNTCYTYRHFIGRVKQAVADTLIVSSALTVSKGRRAAGCCLLIQILTYQASCHVCGSCKCCYKFVWNVATTLIWLSAFIRFCMPYETKIHLTTLHAIKLQLVSDTVSAIQDKHYTNMIIPYDKMINKILNIKFWICEDIIGKW